MEKAHQKIRHVFRSNLTDYCQVDGQNIYNERVFELSSLMALRKRIKNPEDSLEGTGFPEFTKALNTFLTQERAIAEFRQARTLAKQAYNQTHEAIERRLPLLAEGVEQLKEKIDSVEPEFQQLNDIRDRFDDEIKNTRDRKAKEIANSFREYVLNLGNTFEEDFLRYQPDLGFLDFLSQDRREAFNNSFKQAFERYITERISAWEITAEQDLEKTFSELAKMAANYGAIYSKVTNAIDEKLIGKKALHPCGMI